MSSPATQLNLQQAQIGEQTSQPGAESRSVPLTLGPVPHIPLQFGGGGGGGGGGGCLSAETLRIL